jgi:hypothetical protein
VLVWGVSIRNIRPALAALAILVLALGVSACGGDSESDEEKIEGSIETALTATGPEACAESRTISYMEELTDLQGAEAEAECEEVVASRKGLPKTITVAKVEVADDGTATAEVTMIGGEPDGLVTEVALVEEDGSWKVDEFVDLVSLDRATFTGKIETEFREEGLGDPEITCLVDKIDQFSQSQFEELALGEDESAVEQISEECESELEGGEEEPAEEEPAEEGSTEEGSTEYPTSVQQNFLDSCLATSGGDSSACECSLDALEERFSIKELEEAEADISSGRIREMIEYAAEACA